MYRSILSLLESKKDESFSSTRITAKLGDDDVVKVMIISEEEKSFLATVTSGKSISCEVPKPCRWPVRIGPSWR